MLSVIPFLPRVDAAMLAGIALWSLALYLGFSPVSEWVMAKLEQGISGVVQSLYASLQNSVQDQDLQRKTAESLSAFLASLLSVIPFLVAGGLCNWGVEAGLGRSWTISMGIIACIGCGVYELGRRDGRSIE